MNGRNDMIWKLFLDDERYPTDNSWVIARNFDDAVWYVTNYGLPVFISFDHDLGHPNNRTGYDFVKWLGEYMLDNNFYFPTKFAYYIHSQNPVGAKNIQHYMSALSKELEYHDKVFFKRPSETT
jgi:hypothetical protein